MSVPHNFNDPNGDLDNDDLNSGLRTAASVFRRCKIEPQIVEGFPCKTLIMGQLGTTKHLVYARVTHSMDEETGTGPMPPALIDAARELNAAPHMVRVNLTPVGPGIAFHYFGIDELEAILKSHTKDWRSLLLKGKTVQDFVRLTHGPLNRLDIIVECICPDPAKPPSTTDEATLRGIYSEFGEDALAEGPPLSVRLLIDGTDVWKSAIDIVALTNSCRRDDEYWIFTCDCGEPGCAGIDRGVTVVTDNGVTLWKAYGLPRKRIFLFDQALYRQTVVAAARRMIELYRPVGEDAQSPAYFHPLSRIEAALYELG